MKIFFQFVVDFFSELKMDMENILSRKVRQGSGLISYHQRFRHEVPSFVGQKYFFSFSQFLFAFSQFFVKIPLLKLEKFKWVWDLEFTQILAPSTRHQSVWSKSSVACHCAYFFKLEKSLGNKPGRTEIGATLKPQKTQRTSNSLTTCVKKRLNISHFKKSKAGSSEIYKDFSFCKYQKKNKGKTF